MNSLPVYDTMGKSFIGRHSMAARRRKTASRRSMHRTRHRADPVRVLLFILLGLLAAGIAVLIYLYYSKKLRF